MEDLPGKISPWQFSRRRSRLLLGWNGMIAWLLVVLLVSTVASLAPTWCASRLTVREVLAYE